MPVHYDYFDLTLPLSNELVVWPGDPPLELRRLSSIAQGQGVNTRRLIASTHAGTHVDAPHHYLEGEAGVESLALDILCGPCHVIELSTHGKHIDAQCLAQAGIPPGTERLLVRTDNSHRAVLTQQPFVKDYVAFDESGADWLGCAGIRLVGIDAFSIAPFEQDRPTHIKLFELGIVIVEGLELSRIAPGHYELFCLPLLIPGSDGAPVRAILRRTR